MPLVRVVTNLKEFPKNFDDVLVDSVAAAFKKDPKDIMVEVFSGVHMHHGKDPDYTIVHIAVTASKNIIDHHENEGYAKKITDAVKSSLNLPGDKIVTTFHGLDPHNVACNGIALAH